MDTNERLFEYVRQIIYDPEHAALQKDGMSDSEKRLADGLEVLHQYLEENHEFSMDLTHGVIGDAHIPGRDNLLAGPLKAVHGTLSHLIWLMDEVASGDYKQRLNLNNDLSRSFNAMVSYLVELSLQDKLTGLLNQDGFFEKAKLLLGTAPGDGMYYIVNANVNDFKHFNALYGAEKGDQLLVNVASFLRNICQQGEICAHIHADKFMCLLKGKDPEEIAKRIDIKDAHNWFGVNARAHLFRFGVYPVENRNADIRLMCECATFANDSIRHKAMQGYAIFDSQLKKEYFLQKTILTHYNQAVQNEEFEVYYHPMNDAKTQQVIGGEALVRWNSPRGKLILPGEFIKLFEINGLIMSLDFYVLEHVCRFLRSRLDRKLPIVPIAVNFSRIHMMDEKFVQHMKSVLLTYQIDPQWIEVEITETAFFERMDDMQAMIKELHRAGFTIAMDDFGNGFSSLNFLKTIPIDIIKIDQLFFKDFDTDSRVAYLIEDILSIAHHLRLRTVAEGIETKSEAEFLRDKGCDTIQGYYFYKPMKRDAFDQLLPSK